MQNQMTHRREGGSDVSCQNGHIRTISSTQHVQTRHTELEPFLDQLASSQHSAQAQELRRPRQDSTFISGARVGAIPAPAPDEAAAACRDRHEEVFRHWQPNAPGESDVRPICHEHGCNGRVFSSAENYRRHVRERARSAAICCPWCDSSFSRKHRPRSSVARGRTAPSSPVRALVPFLRPRQTKPRRHAVIDTRKSFGIGSQTLPVKATSGRSVTNTAATDVSSPAPKTTAVMFGSEHVRLRSAVPGVIRVSVEGAIWTPTSCVVGAAP
nr:hypothetical protein CFP56_04403 [Quercus suber]